MKRFWLFPFFCLTFNAYALTCVYPDREVGLVEREDCGEISSEGLLRVNDLIKNAIDFPDSLPACLLVDQGSGYAAYYLSRQGKTQATLFFDNGCDYFQEELARTHVNGKAAFIDTALNVTLITDFELANPFYYEHAVVCNGPFQEITDGEHTLLKGGQCGLLNHQGELVVPANYNIDERDVFTAYINNHNECQPPPVTVANQALCHAHRHTRHLEYHSDDWSWYQVRKGKEVWYIDFLQTQEPDTKLTLELDAATAQWNSIVPLEDNQ